MNKLNLYPFCDKWFEKGGSIWIFSDPHFNDPDSKYFNPNGPTAEEMIKKINSKCGKNDTLICLGDVGDLDCVKKLRAGYKVLVKGNHDEGKTKFQRIITHKKYIGHDFCPQCGKQTISYGGPSPSDSVFNYFDENSPRGWCRECVSSVFPIKNYEGETTDNKLFDEVYEGPLIIRKDIILSHEEIDFKYAFNIHGHDHSGNKLLNTMFKRYDSDLYAEDYIQAQLNSIKEFNLKDMNCCFEWLGYNLLNLKDLINSGVLTNILDIHRDTIDNAIKRKKSK